MDQREERKREGGRIKVERRGGMGSVGQREGGAEGKATFLGQRLRRGRRREPTVTFSCRSKAATCSDGREEEEGVDDKGGWGGGWRG